MKAFIQRWWNQGDEACQNTLYNNSKIYRKKERFVLFVWQTEDLRSFFYEKPSEIT